MIRTFLCMCLAAVCVSAVCFADAVDDSSPKAAALKFAKAVENGDAATARELVVGNEQEKHFIESTVAFIQARKKLKDVATKKYADKAADLADLRGSMSAVIPEMNVQIDGDNATLTPPKTWPDTKPIPMTKVGGKWKVKLSALLAQSAPPTGESAEQNLAEIQSTLTMWTTAINELCTEIEQGKYQTAEEAKAALAAKAQAAATRPTTAPAE